MYIRYFFVNYNICSKIKHSKDQKRSLLQPLLILNSFFGKSKINIISNFTSTNNYINLFVIENTLSKLIIFEPVLTIEIKVVIKIFFYYFIKYQSWPQFNVRNRSTNRTNYFQKRFCDFLGIAQLLNNIFYPQTDNKPKRIIYEAQVF